MLWSLVNSTKQCFVSLKRHLQLEVIAISNWKSSPSPTGSHQHLQLEVIAISNWKSSAPSTGIYQHFCLEVIGMSV